MYFSVGLVLVFPSFIADNLELLIRCSLFFLSAVLIFLFSPTAFGQDATAPGECIVEPPMFICLGFEWYIEGNTNPNAETMANW